MLLCLVTTTKIRASILSKIPHELAPAAEPAAAEPAAVGVRLSALELLKWMHERGQDRAGG